MDGNSDKERAKIDVSRECDQYRFNDVQIGKQTKKMAIISSNQQHHQSPINVITYEQVHRVRHRVNKENIVWHVLLYN